MVNELFLIFIGGVFGWVLNHFVRIQSENALIIDEHIKELKKLSDMLVDYWLSNPTNSSQDRLDAARIRAQHSSLSYFYGEAKERLLRKRVRTYQVLSLRIFKSGLGGSFDTEGRAADIDTAIVSSTLISELIHELRLARREILSFRALTSRIAERFRSWYTAND